MKHDTFTGERTLWWRPADHLEEFRKITDWYFEAMLHCAGQRVLDLGSGNCFGTFLLSTVAEEVHGYDVLLPQGPDDLPMQCETTFHVCDLEQQTPKEEGDIAVAIEVIEHLANPEFMLAHLKAPRLFFTVPCYGNKNEFHKIEYTEESCKALVEAHYPHLSYRMERRRMIGIATR